MFVTASIKGVIMSKTADLAIAERLEELLPITQRNAGWMSDLNPHFFSQYTILDRALFNVAFNLGQEVEWTHGDHDHLFSFNHKWTCDDKKVPKTFTHDPRSAGSVHLLYREWLVLTTKIHIVFQAHNAAKMMLQHFFHVIFGNNRPTSRFSGVLLAPWTNVMDDWSNKDFGGGWPVYYCATSDLVEYWGEFRF